MSDIVRFAIPDFDGVSAVFGAHSGDYLTREECGEYYGFNNPYAAVAQALFGRGGKISDYGLRWKKDVDETKAYRALKALLSSWDPKHEIKMGTVGKMLADNTDGKIKMPKRGKS